VQIIKRLRQLLTSTRPRSQRRRGRSHSSESLEPRALLAAVVPAIQVDGQAPDVWSTIGNTSLLKFEDEDSTRLFTSDGTQAGTQLFADIPARSVSRASKTFLFDDMLLFTATGAEGRELWYTDGTSGGTGLLKDINPGAVGSYPGEFARLGDHVYFAAHTAEHGCELWRTDGTTAGTTLVADLQPGTADSNPYGGVPFQGELVFATRETGDVWRSDGTAAGSSVLIELSDGYTRHPVGKLNGRLLLLKDWKVLESIDSLTEPLLTEVDRETTDANVFQLRPIRFVNNRLVYQMGDFESYPYADREVRSTDGTSESVETIWDEQIPSRYFGSGYILPNGETDLLFLDPIRTDGTAAGTRLADIPLAATTPVGDDYFIMSYDNWLLQLNESLTDRVPVLDLGQYEETRVKLESLGQSLMFEWPVNGGTALWRYDSDGVTPDGPVILSPEANEYLHVDRTTLQWQAVPGAVEYELRVGAWEDRATDPWGRSYDERAVQLTETSYEITEPLPRGERFNFIVRGVLSDGSVTEWSAAQFVNSLAPRNLRGLGGEPFSDEVILGIVDPSLPWGDRPVTYLSTTTGEVLKKGQVNFGIPREGLRTGVGYLELDKRPADGLVTVRMGPREKSQARLDLMAGPGNLDADFTNGQITLRWNGFESASRYDIWINDMTNGVSQYVREPNWESTSYTAAFGNGTYRMWVRAKQTSDGPATNWSQPIGFTTAGAPYVLGPTGMLYEFISPSTLHWSLVQGAQSYEVWVNNLTTGTRVLHQTDIDGNIRSLVAEPGFGLGRHAVWVRARLSGGGFTDWSDVKTFTVVPGPIETVSGVQNTVDATPVIEWESQHYATHYELWVSARGTTAPIYRQRQLQSHIHEVTEPLPKGDYDYWVRGFGPDGLQSPWSEAFPLSVGGMSRITTGSSSYHRPLTDRTVEWTSVVDATSYELWVDYLDNPRQNEIVHVSGLSENTYQLSSDLPAGRYRAWVRAIRNEDGAVYTSYWSRLNLFLL